MTTEQRFWNKVKKTKTCWVWTGSQKRGCSYARGNFRPGGMAEKVTASRFSWQLKNGAIAKGLCVLHKCDNGLCVKPSHLFLGTQADNIADMDKKGRRKTTAGYPGLKGVKNPTAKLLEADITFIRKAYKRGGVSQRILGKKFGVSQTLVGLIVRREIWSHV